MRGLTSILIEVMPVGLGLVFLGVVIAGWVVPAPGPRSRVRLVMTGFVLAFVWLVGQRFVHQLAWRHGLAELTREGVDRVEVDGHVLEQEEGRSAVLAALREAEWFSPNHGGWARTIPLRVTLADGRVRRYDVGRYTREVGAVIAFQRPGSFGTWSDGYAFSPGLPQALAAAGRPLP